MRRLDFKKEKHRTFQVFYFKKSLDRGALVISVYVTRVTRDTRVT
jgi:hypothetical protein